MRQGPRLIMKGRHGRASSISPGCWHGQRGRMGAVPGYFLSFTTTPFKATPAMMPPAWHSYSVGLEKVSFL
jgi:hypothetical protein